MKVWHSVRGKMCIGALVLTNLMLMQQAKPRPTQDSSKKVMRKGVVGVSLKVFRQHFMGHLAWQVFRAKTLIAIQTGNKMMNMKIGPMLITKLLPWMSAASNCSLNDGVSAKLNICV